MKKAFALIIFVVLALAACSGAAFAEENTAPAATEQAGAASEATAEPIFAERVPARDPVPVRMGKLCCYVYEDDGEAFTFLALAIKAPEKSSWSLVTSEGDPIDTSNSSYAGYASYSIIEETEGESCSILLFNELAGAYVPTDLALSVTYAKDDGTEVTRKFGEWSAPMTPELRSSYGVHDFGGFIGFVSQASAFGDENAVGAEFVMTSIPFDGNRDAVPYTNAAEQFSFFAKDGTPLAEALGYSQFEITNNGIDVTLKFNVQEGEPSGESAANALEETMGYMEYARDDGEVIRVDIHF